MEGVIKLIVDLLAGVGSFFINPVFYIAIALSVLLGFFRVKKERQLFRNRIDVGGAEIAGLVKQGAWMALVFSVIIIGFGIVVPIQWLVAVSVISIVLLLVGSLHFGSFVYIAAGAVALGWIFQTNGWTANLLFMEFSGFSIDWQWILPVTLITGLVVFAEGVLIRKFGSASSSPRTAKSARGMNAAFYSTKRLWLLPMLLLVPGTLVETYAPFWPQLPIGESALSIILFPIIIGFQQQARVTMPIYLYPRIGKAVQALGAAIFVLSFVSFLWAPSAFLVLLTGLIGRAGIGLYFALKERNGNFAVAPQSKGVMIVDVLPESPAAKMGLVRGEVIRKVNGLRVTNESELYEAIQVNAAHCRLEVLDHRSDVRLRQHVIFHHDHHRLGLIVLS